MKLTDDQRRAGEALLKRVPSVDIHSHPGRFFLSGEVEQTALAASMDPPFHDQVAVDMKKGRVSAVLFAAVSDYLVLESTSTGLKAGREFRPGEAIKDYQRQINVLKFMVEMRKVQNGLNVSDVNRAHDQSATACIFSVEGGDYLEDKLDRIHTSYAEGVRSITIIHYRTNQIGDPQTAGAVHGGLTPLGRSVVREMNKAGMIVDLSHASFDATKQAVAASTKPMMISHSNLLTPGLNHPRLITLEHARMVSTAGGIIGAIPAGAGQLTFENYIDSILHMVDVLGVDHVAVGTDMHFTFKSVFADYNNWHLIPAALLAKGMHENEVAKVIGGNFLRLFKEAS